MLNKSKILNSIFLLPAIAGLLVACTSTPRAISTAYTPSCESAFTLPDNIASQKIITIGEIHGTTEIPAAVGQLACSFLKQGKQVMVGLELDNAALSAMLKYQASAKKEADIATLRQFQFWDKGQDGRASVAMADLIAELQRFKQIGLQIDVFAFDELTKSAQAEFKSSPNLYSVLRDKSMTDNIDRAIASAPQKTFILFAGNVHASKKNTVRDAGWQSMANRLVERHALVSFNASFLNGTAWVCLRTGCGANQMRGFADKPSAPFIRIDDNAKTPNFPAYFPAYDGTFFIGGKITASPPFVHSLK
jgi:uncharacterized iron-regulated protein